MITRRKLIEGLSIIIAAPAIIRVAQLMPISVQEREPFPYIFIGCDPGASNDCLSISYLDQNGLLHEMKRMDIRI